MTETAARSTVKTKKIVALGMLSAIAYVVMVIGRIPVILFLKYDPKDIIITIGGFIYGPLSALTVSVLVSVVEMFTVSNTGPIGLLMNILSTSAFACVAALIYKKKRTMSGAVVGLLAGTLLMTAVMLLWNALIAPLYMGIPREDVIAMLVPAFLPFNLLKGGINTAATLLIYKPVVNALRRSNLAPASVSGSMQESRNLGLTLTAGLVLATCVLIILAIRGLI